MRLRSASQRKAARIGVISSKDLELAVQKLAVWSMTTSADSAEDFPKFAAERKKLHSRLLATILLVRFPNL